MIINYTDAQLRAIACNALAEILGFRPARAKSIILLEASGDGEYIRFKVTDTEYELMNKSDLKIYSSRIY